MNRYSSRVIGLKTSLKVHSVFSLMDILNMLLFKYHNRQDDRKITSQICFKWRIHPPEFWLESQLWLTIVNFTGKQRADGNGNIFSYYSRILERISIIILKAIEVWTPILACFWNSFRPFSTFILPNVWLSTSLTPRFLQ